MWYCFIEVRLSYGACAFTCSPSAQAQGQASRDFTPQKQALGVIGREQANKLSVVMDREKVVARANENIHCQTLPNTAKHVCAIP
jgi:hypothetical protein